MCCSPGPYDCPRGSGTSGSTARSRTACSTADWEQTAESFAALGNAVRLRLLREILGGRRTAAELAELEGLGTTGQIYHHLRQLTGAGWLHTPAVAATRCRAPGWCRCSWCWPPPARTDVHRQGGTVCPSVSAHDRLPLLRHGLLRPGRRRGTPDLPLASVWLPAALAIAIALGMTPNGPRGTGRAAARRRGGAAGHRPLVGAEQPRRQGAEPRHARLRTDVRDRHRGRTGGGTPAPRLRLALARRPAHRDFPAFGAPLLAVGRRHRRPRRPTASATI